MVTNQMQLLNKHLKWSYNPEAGPSLVRSTGHDLALSDPQGLGNSGTSVDATDFLIMSAMEKLVHQLYLLAHRGPWFPWRSFHGACLQGSAVALWEGPKFRDDTYM